MHLPTEGCSLVVLSFLVLARSSTEYKHPNPSCLPRLRPLPPSGHLLDHVLDHLLSPPSVLRNTSCHNPTAEDKLGALVPSCCNSSPDHLPPLALGGQESMRQLHCPSNCSPRPPSALNSILIDKSSSPPSPPTPNLDLDPDPELLVLDLDLDLEWWGQGNCNRPRCHPDRP